ncbi:MAG: hypothetical protein J6B28_02770 [Eubacterium sp.]|nr:hypothetical protein [Eubacterium sp.]
MDASTICFKLDLILQLVDTTTGNTVDEKDVRFYKNGNQIRPIPRGSGNFVFINTGRENFVLTLKVFGYEECRMLVEYEKLDEMMPLKQVFLIPSENYSKGEKLLSLTGTLSGLEEIEAVDLAHSYFCISEFDERKRLMKLFLSQGRLNMESVHYGLISGDRKRFEHFEVLKENPPDEVKLKQPLQEPFVVNAPISRVIFGKVSEDGKYLLRVRDNATILSYLVRYCVNGEWRFQTVDFHNCKENELE